MLSKKLLAFAGLLAVCGFMTGCGKKCTTKRERRDKRSKGYNKQARRTARAERNYMRK